MMHVSDGIRCLSVVSAIAVSAFARECPTGNEWEDLTRLSEGKLPPHAWFGSFPDVDSARKIRPELSPRRLSLDSEKDWRFRWSRRPSERPADFYRTDYDVSSWDVVKVPCSWQAAGIRADGRRYGMPIFVNQPYVFVPPFPANSNCWPRVTGHALPKDWTFDGADNPIGSYRRDFDVPAGWLGDEFVLQFDGVESFFYLWVNGTYVGFSKNSRSPAAFDVTRLVKAGRNTVAVEVYRNSDGSYLECQDIYRLSGIIRSVGLTHRPKTHLEDVRLTTVPVVRGAYDGDWRIALDVRQTGGARVVTHLFADDGSEVAAPDLVVRRPKLWSAEEPNLYTLVVALEKDGQTLEAAGFQVGFREVEIRDPGSQRDRVFLFNGRPIKLKGVNRGETDPLYGHHVPDARLEEDVRLLKLGNFNHVRNSHMPQPGYFYYLCNLYGVYVMDEANVESHGFYYGKESLSNQAAWREAHLDRQASMYEWNKNFPCVVIWSMGNEAGPGDNFKACYDYLKERDSTRPVQYERNNWITDMGSRQYPSVEWMWRCARGDPTLPDITRGGTEQLPTRYPYHVNEYAHNFNNGCGNLADFQEAIESSDRIMGGALWDWADQALWQDVDGRRVAAWGGCFGEKPEEGQGIMDGIVTCDRRCEPGYEEARHVFQNFKATYGWDGLRLKNKCYFRDSSAYMPVWTLLEDGVARDQGSFDLVLKPLETRLVPLPEGVRKRISSADRAELSLRVDFRLKRAEGLYPAGWTIASDQVLLREGRFTAESGAAGAAVVVDGTSVRTGDWTYTFSRTTGELVSLRKGGEELLAAPMTLDCFRVPVGGETFYRPERIYFGRQRLMDGLRDMRPQLTSFTGPVADGDGVVTLSVASVYRGTRKEDMPTYGHANAVEIVDCGPLERDSPAVETKSEWCFCGNGVVTLKTTFRGIGRPVEFQRLGWRLVFRQSETTVDYFACGPYDNYSDRKSGCFPARYSARSSDFGFAFGCSQDGGNREEARFVRLVEPGLRVSARTPLKFAFAVSPYSTTELLKCPHPELLPKPSKTELGLYARVRGLGSGNCGPYPLPQDVIYAGESCVLDVRLAGD